VQIGLLGPFEVRTDDGVFAEVPGARLRGLLIALALESGHVVPKATLIDWIWGERPPSDAANALQRLASRLRKALRTGLIEGQPGGYRLTVAPGGFGCCAKPSPCGAVRPCRMSRWRTVKRSTQR
jgi:DNA-binding SARP family transcriptional activator